MEHPAKLSVFDLDHTLVRKNTSFSYCFTLFRKKEIPLSTLLSSILYYIRHRFFQLPLEDLHRSVFDKLLKGLPNEILEKHVDLFIEETLSKTLNFPVYSRLKLAQHLGHYTVILSNSPSFLVRSIAQYFEVDDWGATEYAVDKDKKICNISSLMQGEDKAKWVERLAARWNISKESITAYSDSYFDLPFLLAAGKAVAVNPDKRLRQFAVENHWEII